MMARLVFPKICYSFPDPAREEPVDNVAGRVRSYCLSLRVKYRYAPTFTKLITTQIMFQMITGREAINKP